MKKLLVVLLLNFFVLTLPVESMAAKKCLIKGNVTKSKGKISKIYHLPGMSYYKRTVIKKSEGDRYFCSERGAKKAGFRKSKK